MIQIRKEIPKGIIYGRERKKQQILSTTQVMISFKLDKQLQTISNYFLFSLAVADFTIGVFSMPMFTVYTIVGKSLSVHDNYITLD